LFRHWINRGTSIWGPYFYFVGCVGGMVLLEMETKKNNKRLYHESRIFFGTAKINICPKFEIEEMGSQQRSQISDH